MNIQYLEEVESFQQKVHKVRFEGTLAYSKQILSDYSWWTFEDVDIFETEVTALALLPEIGVGPRLLHADAAERLLVTEALVQSRPAGDAVEPYLDRVVEFLGALRGLTRPNWQPRTIEELACSFAAKGEAAGVNPVLLHQLLRGMEGWHRLYGAELAFVHGDLHFGNLLSDGNGVIGLIDFEESMVSVPIFDAINIAWSAASDFGPEAYIYFKNAYEKAFGVPLIPLEDWRRFHVIRRWIVSCYLPNCCPPSLREAAKSYFVEAEPPLDG